MNPTIQIDIVETIVGLLKIIAWLIAGFGSMALVAVGYHVYWKRKVDKHILEDKGFQQKVMDQMEKGAELMGSHTTTLRYYNFRMEKIERQYRGMNTRMRELIRDHNQHHKANLEIPPIEEEPPEIFRDAS